MYNTVPGATVRLTMTGLDASGAYSGIGTGSPLDVNVGSFSSLRALFSQQPTVYPTAQSGLPPSWWYDNNLYVAYTRPTNLSLASWYNAAPGGPAYQFCCNLQGVNISM